MAQGIRHCTNTGTDKTCFEYTRKRRSTVKIVNSQSSFDINTGVGIIYGIHL